MHIMLYLVLMCNSRGSMYVRMSCEYLWSFVLYGDATTWWQRCPNCFLMSTEFDSSTSSSPGSEMNQGANSGTQMAASFQVATPDPFTFSRPEEWVKWIRRFERFRVASGLAQSGSEHAGLRNGGPSRRHPALVCSLRGGWQEVRNCQEQI